MKNNINQLGDRSLRRMYCQICIKFSFFLLVTICITCYSIKKFIFSTQCRSIYGFNIIFKININDFFEGRQPVCFSNKNVLTLFVAYNSVSYKGFKATKDKTTANFRATWASTRNPSSSD
jgi:hypothetical protein